MGEVWDGSDPRMLYIGGSKRSVRCEECGANVFTPHATDKRRYKCNGCGATYTVEDAKS